MVTALLGAVLVPAALITAPPALAHNVGQGNTYVVVSPASAELLIDRALAGGGGIQTGDVIDYIMRFEPINSGADDGPGGYATFYPPSYTTVLDAAFVEPSGEFYADVAAPDPGDFYDGVGPGAGFQTPFGAPYNNATAWPEGNLTQLYGDTGVFFSTSASTAKYVGAGVDPDTTPLADNGYPVSPTGGNENGAHNVWDRDMVDTMGSGGGSIVASGRGNTPFLAGSPVAGPNTYYKYDDDQVVGPWQRLAYPGSTIGIGAPATVKPGARVSGPGVAWDYTTAGAASIPAGVTAIRWAVGGLYVGDTNYVRVRVRFDSPPPGCAPMDGEVFGGDAGYDDGGKDNQWRYYDPVPANGNACLVMVKSGPEAAIVGTNVTYSVRFANVGYTDLTNVTIADELDPGTTFVSASNGGAGGGTVTWPVIPLLAPGEAYEYTVTINAPAATLGTSVANTASIVSDQTLETIDSSETDIVDSAAELEVSKSVVSDPTPVEGDTVTYELSVTNNGPEATTNVLVDDALPTGLTFSGVGAGGDGSYDSVGGVWTVPTLGIGATATIQVLATVDVGTKGQTLTNTATNARSDIPDPNLTNNEDSDDIVVGPFSDLGVTKTVNDLSPLEGETITFTIDVINNGGDDAENTVVNDLLPAGLTYVGSTPPAGTTYNEISGVWDIGTLADGATISMTVSATVNAGTDGTNIDNTATVSSDSFDVVPDNDSDTAGIFVGVAADLQVIKTVDNPTPQNGDTIVFTLEVDNLGTDPATGVVLTDLLPAGLTFVSASDPGYDDTTGEWTIGNVASNGVSTEATLTITATVDPSTTGAVTNTATVSGNEGDPDLTNNVSSVEVVVLIADLSITKTVDEPGAANGDPVVFTLTVTNNGPDDATDVTASDLVNTSDFAITGSNPSQGTYTTGTGLWDIGAIPSGGSVTLAINADVVAANDTNAPNTATVTSPIFDPDLTNNSSTAVVVVDGNPADIEVTKTVDDAAPIPGDTIQFTIVAVNNGPADEDLLVISDVLPAGLTFVSASTAVGTFSNPNWALGELKEGESATLTIDCHR